MSAFYSSDPEEDWEKQRAQEREDFAALIDDYIRTLKGFIDSRPLDFSLELFKIIAEFESKRHPLFVPETIDEFVRSHIRFIVVDSLVRLKFLTPFQGADSHRVFGEFYCSTCFRRWKSASSWKNKWQQCQNCNTKIYPYQQHALERKEETDETPEQKRPHDMARCQKCIELGRLCVPSMFYSN